MLEMKFKKIYYDIFMILLSFIIIVMLALEVTMNLDNNIVTMFDIIDKSIYSIFVLDYLLRLIYSKNKLEFIKKNIIDLISIIPFNSLFKALRVIKAVRILTIAKVIKISNLLRLTAVLARLKSKANRFLKTNNLNYVLIVTITLILLGAMAIGLFENMSFLDSLWWATVTATTVGYGDLSPSTLPGRIIAIILMLTGIGTIGMLTGSMATFFIKDNNNHKKHTYSQEVIKNIKDKLDNLELISDEDLKEMFDVLVALKKNKQASSNKCSS